MLQKLINSLRRMGYKMNLFQGKKDIWDGRQLPDYSDFYSKMETWKKIYQCDPPWNKVGCKLGKREISRLNAANNLCKELAALTFSEQVTITLSDDLYHSFVHNTLQQNNFWASFPNWLELAYAIGGGALSAYLSDGKIIIDYVDGDRFAPAGWDNQRIFNGIFTSESYMNGFYYTLLRRETIDQKKKCIHITHELFQSKTKDELGVEYPIEKIYPFLSPDSTIENCETPLFCYFKPACANFIDTDSPLGISVYANALDTLKSLDIAFDSFSREFILGRKRIIIPTSAMRSVINPETGKMERYFDANDEAYEAFNLADAENLKITDNTVELRIDEHVSAINALLNILCFQTGLSAGSLSFDATSGGVKTATEVISQNSKTYRSKKAHQNLLAEVLEQLIDAIIALGISLKAIPLREYKVSIGFDDSIIVDTNTKIDNHIKLVGANLESKLRAIQDIFNCSEDDAKKELAQISQENSIQGTPDDWFREEVIDDTDRNTETMPTNQSDIPTADR